MNDLVKQWDKVSDEFKKEVLKARKRGMNKAVQKIRNTTKKFIKSSFPNATKTSDKYNDSMIEGARVTKYKESTLVGEAVAGAHIMGLRKKGSGTFRLRFFEGGTEKRFIKDHKRKSKNGVSYHVKGHYTGSVKGKSFFSNAVSTEINKATSIIEEELNKAINKCNNG